MELERLQKVMAQSGVASRRACEEYIKAGRVKVDGKTITELGFKVSLNQEILVDNKPILKQEKVYYLMNKPEGFLTTTIDAKGRKTIFDLLDDNTKTKRLFTIGQLDYNMSGALIITNDGEIANRLMKKAKSFEKVYQIRIKGILTQEKAEKLIRGFVVEGQKTNRASLSNLSFDQEHESTFLEIKIVENYQGEIIKIFETLGNPIKKIKRQAFAGLTIEGLSRGQYRILKPHEIKQLYAL